MTGKRHHQESVRKIYNKTRKENNLKHTSYFNFNFNMQCTLMKFDQ